MTDLLMISPRNIRLVFIDQESILFSETPGGFMNRAAEFTVMECLALSREHLNSPSEEKRILAEALLSITQRYQLSLRKEIDQMILRQEFDGECG